MALWNKVSSGFNADDETVNFGARTVAENNGSIYETSTLANIQSDGQVITNPKVSASVQYSMLCVAVDKSITIFSDESCHEIVLSVGFDSIITTYCMSKDCSFLLIALATGILHCLHIPSGGKQVFYENIEEKFGDAVIKIFLQEDGEKTNVIIVASSGDIYGINGLDLRAAHRALVEDDEDCLEEILKTIDCTKLFEGSKANEAACIDLGPSSNKNPVIVTIGKDIQLWPSERRCEHSSVLPFEYTKVQFFKNYGAMICLRTDGVLSVVCMETLLGRKLWKGPVADFVTVQDKINDPYQIVILTVPEKHSDTTLLQFCSFPDFEIKFEITVPKTTYLVDLVGCSLENVIFLEGIKNSQTRIDTIRVKAIVESVPEYRLQRLLRREQFEEAEFFAKQFQLSLNSVHEAKAAAFINKLGPWTNDSDDNEKLEIFVATLDKINDVRYVFDCCNNALTSNYKQTRRLLLYAHERLTRNIGELDSREFENLLPTLNATLRKLETFEIIRKTRLKVVAGETEDTEEWIRFSRTNLLDECIKHLSLNHIKHSNAVIFSQSLGACCKIQIERINRSWILTSYFLQNPHNSGLSGELEAAAAIWIRHIPEMATLINKNSISDILQSISETTEPQKLWPWLCHFVPSVITLLPSALPDIILWGYKKTKSLEKFCRKDWPQVGLDFARSLVDLLSFRGSNVCFYFHQQYSSKNSHLHRLMTLVQAMTDLLELKNHHRIVIPLETYLDDSTNVIHLLLNKSHVDEIPNLVENFLQRYILNNSLQNDQVFCTYVQKTLRNSKGWWFWDKAPWEQRISIVISYIHNIQNRLQQTVDVLKKAPVPWSDTVNALAEVSCTFDHPLVSKIRTESNGVAVKLILKKYGYAHIGLCDRLFRYIIKQDRNDMMNDICELTKADNSMRLKAFCWCTNHHLNNGNIDKAMEVLRHLDDDTARYCCEQIVNNTIAGLGLKTRDKSLANYVEALDVVREKLKQIVSRKSGCAVEFNNAFNVIPHLKRIWKLDEQFDLRIDVSEYHEDKQRILELYVDQLASDVENDEKSVLTSCQCLEKVSNLLELSTVASMLIFYEKIRDTAILKHCITRLALQGTSSKSERSCLSKLCWAWINNADRDYESSLQLRNVCSSNLVNCDDDELVDAVACSNRSIAYVAVIGNEGACDSEPEHRISSQSNFTLYTTYKDAAVSSGLVLLPLYKDSLTLYNFFAMKSQSRGNRLEDVDEACEDEISLLVKSLLERTKRIQNEHHDHSLLQITKDLHYGLCSLSSVNSDVIIETRAVMAHCIFTLLRKIVSARSLDVGLGLACLFMLTDQEASKWLSTACRSFQGDLIRHRAVVELGYEYYKIIKHNEQLYVYDCQKLLHRWARRLTSYGISYKEVLTSDMETKRNILERVMKTKKSNLLPLLEEFSLDFGFELNDCFLLYLQVLMSDWQPRLNFTVVSGRKELKINENDVQELNAKCKEVAAKIDDKGLMKRHLTKLSPQINFYHYEVFLAMLDLLEEKNVDRIEHFCFLQHYTRYGQPTECEREEWAAICHENSSLPPIAQWRMPFLPKIDQWKLITPELNLKTYEKWLSIAPTLKLQSHVVCSLAVKGSVAEAWKHSIGNRDRHETWCLYPRNSSLLKDIKTCIRCMTGPEGLHYATAALYYVFNHTPQGADQVAAAQECYASAQLWEQQSDEPDEGMIEKIKDKYLRLTSKHILHTHGLGEERYLSLIGYPEKLIRELYNDESIPDRCKGAIQRRPDVNSAANALGNIFSMNMMKIRFDLLLDWLQPETWEGKPNDSMTMGFGTTQAIVEDDPIVEDNLLRACYILGSGETTLYANFLINIGFDKKKEDGYGPGVRYRALRVLQSITDESTLQDLTKRDLNNVREYMRSLRYLNELESLGLGYSVSSFETCSKHKLAQILLKTQYYTPRALSLILQICLDFGVHDHSLLNATLERMAKQSMVKDLEKALPMMGTLSNMENSSGYVAGWQVVIAHPFGKLDPRPNSKQIDDCVASLRLLHACPVVTKLEFKDVINRCFHCQQSHLTAALLPFLNDRDRDYVLQEIRENYKVDEVIVDLTSLMPKGILVASQSLLMLQDISSTKSVHNGKLDTTIT